MNERRLVDIETKLAFQDDALLTLNQVVCQQQERINQLELTCRLLVTRVQELAKETPAAPLKPSEETPPHY